MKTEFCESCGQPAAPHNVTDCFKELVHKRKVADAMYDAAIVLVHKFGDAEKIEDRELRTAVISLDLATWRYAM